MPSFCPASARVGTCSQGYRQRNRICTREAWKTAEMAKAAAPVSFLNRKGRTYLPPNSLIACARCSSIMAPVLLESSLEEGTEVVLHDQNLKEHLYGHRPLDWRC